MIIHVFRTERLTQKCPVGRKSKTSSLDLVNYSLDISPTENMRDDFSRSFFRLTFFFLYLSQIKNKVRINRFKFRCKNDLKSFFVSNKNKIQTM